MVRLGGQLGRIFRKKSDVLVEVRQVEAALCGFELDDAFGCGYGDREPLALRMAAVEHRAHAIGGDEEILAKGVDGLVVLELAPAVVGFCRWRKDFDDDG